MNTPEKIAGAYLRLNGFFLLPHFTLFDGASHTHVDFLVLRPPNGREKCGGIELPLDDSLFRALSRILRGDSQSILLGGVVEVKGSRKLEQPQDTHLDYARSFLGDYAAVVGFSFTRRKGVIDGRDQAVVIPLNNAFNWIMERIDWMEGHHLELSKEGSWAWSEDFLSDLLYLRRLLPPWQNWSEDDG